MRIWYRHCNRSGNVKFVSVHSRDPNTPPPFIEVYLCEVSPVNHRGMYCALGPLGIRNVTTYNSFQLKSDITDIYHILSSFFQLWNLARVCHGMGDALEVGSRRCCDYHNDHFAVCVLCSARESCVALPPRGHCSQQGSYFKKLLCLYFVTVILNYFVFRTSLSLLRNVHIAVVEPEIRHLEEAAAKNKMTDQSKGNVPPCLRWTWKCVNCYFQYRQPLDFKA